jgi:two-component system, NtrC family, response regulator GlrR
VRIIAASNKNLEEEVKLGRFREDLFYRIHVIHIKVPPLRERKEDIPLLARHFLRKYAEKMKKETIGFSQEAFQKLMVYTWPGNVRELENCVESAVAMTDKKVISQDLVLQGKASNPSGPMAFKDAKTEFERQYLIHLMEITEGNVSLAAKLAGKYRADLYELLKKHDLDPEGFRGSS